MTDLATLSYLVVDSDPQNRQILSVLLRRVLGSSQVSVWENSHQFEQQFQTLEADPNVIFLGTKVKPLDGLAMLATIQQLQACRFSKVVAVTAQVMPADIAALREAGFDGLISKPIIRQIFPMLVAYIVSGQPVWYIA